MSEINPISRLYSDITHILNTLTIKYNYRAEELETRTSKEKADRYINALAGTDTFYQYDDYSIEEFNKAGITDAKAIEYYLDHHLKITTFAIADTVLKEHMKNHIQVVMLSTTMHQEVHDREIFINVKQAWGDITPFLKKYKLNDELKDKYNRYIDRSMMMDSSSYDLLKASDKIVNG